MSRGAWLAVVLLAPAAFAAKPRGERHDVTVQVLTPTAPPAPPTRLFTGDVGLGGWASSLTGVVTAEAALGLGRRVSKHLLLTGELGLAAWAHPTGYTTYQARISLSAVLAWDVLELVRSARGRSLPFEAGPELGLGVALLSPDVALALGMLQPGAFARYVVSPSLSVGLRLRGHIPYWGSSPWSFHGGRTIGPSTEPSGFTGTLSLVHTY